MSEKTIKMGSAILAIVVVMVALPAYAQLPRGISGTVYMSDGLTPASQGTNFSVNDIMNGEKTDNQNISNLDVIISTNNSMILLKTTTFDSRKGEPSLPSNLSILEYPVDVKGYYIVQFIGPVKPEWKEHLEQLDCEIYDYIPNNAFIIRMDSETKEIVQNLDFVQWIGIYQPAYKISPELPIDEETKINLTVLLFRPEKRDEISSRLEELGGEVLKSSGDAIRLRINASKTEDIAKINDVEWIEQYIQPKILNDVSRWVIQSYVNGSTPVWNHNITGAGQIVGISDSGLDYDCCFFWDSVRGAPPEDSGLPSTVIPDYNQRKVIVYHDVAEFGDYDDDYPGHGTHCSGSIAGDNLATIGSYDTNDGMAYKAKLVFQDLGRDGSRAIYPPADLNDLFQQAYDDDARIHSNSWGSSAFGAYTTFSKQCDEFMWNHKEFLILFANGNDGPSSNTVVSPATAKNVVSVGATENGAMAENMAFFSSHGPTDDGRIKPTVCAPGVRIWSADSDGNIASYNCGVVPMSGTSMSTPTTAGAAALIRQYFVDGYYPTGNATPGDSITPSAALIKAMLVSSGEEMSGSYTEGPIPSNGQGWGRILLDNALYFNGDSRRLEVHDSDSVNTGQHKTYNIAIDNQSEPLEVTLVWTDYPSTPAAAVNLVNDLNLVVMGPGGTYATSDNRNVVESVYIKTPSVGAYTITVTGYNVPEGPQPFALVITGGLGIGSKGVVYLDKDLYNCSSMVNVTVKDADLNADNTTAEKAYVSIMSFPTEITPENITLTETGVDTATFTGSIRLATSAPVPDGNLSVSHGDLITVFYVDADDGTGNPVTVHDTATVDCIAPIITVTTPQNNTTYNSNAVALNYSVNEKTDWEGYSLDGQPIVIISGNTTLTNLTDGWHNVTVFASDIAGNVGASDKIWFNITTPDIWFYPEAFEVILPQGNITNRTLTIGNNGTGVLEFEISDKRGATGLSAFEHPNLSLSANSTSAPDDYVVSTVESKLNGENVLIIKDVDAWGYPANEEVLTNLGIAYDVATSADIAGIDLSSYKVVIIASDQWQSFYDTMAEQVPKLEEYVSNGGILEVHACDWGWNGGEWYELLPGGVGHIHDFDDYNYIVAPEHPIVEGLTDADFVGWSAVSHGSFTDILSDTTVILENSYGNPTFIEYEFGAGVVVASMETLEWAYMHGHCQNGKILYNTIMYTYNLTLGVDWLIEYPQSGTINPSNQTNITVTFNATDLDLGKYKATIVINSNDPDESKVEVPVRLIVTQLHPPDIWVEPKSFDVIAFQDEMKYENLTIGNNGTGDLLFNISVMQHQAMTALDNVNASTEAGDGTAYGYSTIAINNDHVLTFPKDEENTNDVNITGDVALLWRYYTGSRVYSSPAISDIDGDGKQEVVIGSDSNYVYALNGEDGSTLWSYYVTYDVSSSPAIADIDGDGKPEVVFGTEGGYVYALNGEDGSILWYYTGYSIYYSSPAIGDIDGDGKQEIVIGSGYYVYALNGKDGSKAWSYYAGGSIYSSPAIGDIDGDGKIEVVVGSYDNYVYALNGESGSILWSYYTGGDVTSSPALGDIDGDGKLEVVVGSRDNYVYALNGEDGSKLWSYYTGGNIDRTSPALGDIDGDGKLEIVIGSGYYVYALNHEGTKAWSYYTSYSVYSSPAIGDIDGDGKQEIVIGSGYYVYALNHDGTNAWSYYTNGYVSSSPAIEDIDGDGNTDIVVGSEDYYVYALDCSGTYNPCNIEWGTFHHDNMRTGLYAPGIEWIDVTPKSGTVPPKNQTNLTVEINTTSLEVGEYNATIIITHNDILHDTVNIPVNLSVFSDYHDIAVTNITAPDSAEINSSIVINSTISNFGINDEFNITVDFIVDGTNQSNKTIPYLASLASTTVNFTWTAPEIPGIYNLTIYAEPVPEENITWNNQLSKNISVIIIPDIWVYPEEYNLTLEKREVVNKTLTIGNNGTGILNASISASLPTDVDQDNETEIIVRHYSSGYTYIVNNSNLDTFNGWEWRSPYTDSYKGFAIADVNGDGTPDLLEGGYNYLRVYDVKNNRVLYSNLYTGYSYGGTAAGDIDNDGVVEMLVSDYDGYIYVYDGETGLPDAQGHITYPTPYYGTGLGIGDIDNDGVVEVIRADRYGIDIFNGETRALEREISIPSLYGYPDIIFGDANGNGIAEIYVGGEYGYVYAYEWNGVTATQLWRSLDLGSHTRPCGFADADNDGDFEVFIGNSSGYITALNALTGSIESSVFTGHYSYASCAVGDMDKDGVLEIATGNYDGYIRTYTYSKGRFTLEKTSVTDYGSDLGRYTDSILISGAKDPRVFREVSFIQFNETEVFVPPDSSHNVTVTFNATNLNKGTYNANIVINSNDPDENIVNVPVNLSVITPPHIISLSPADLTPTQYVSTTNTFSVITDQVMASNEWHLLPGGITTLGNGTSSLTLTWNHSGNCNITYIGTNENGSVTITWIVTVLEPGTPIITDWYNTKTKDNSTSVTINESEPIYFNATAVQSVDTWNWCKDGINQNINYDNFTTSWSVSGTYTVSVNASNAYGTSNTVVWNVTVKGVPSIEVDKTVWSPVSGTWEKSIEANVSDIVRFKCVLHNNGNYNLTNITAIDKLSDSLEYAYNATHPEHWISSDNRTIEWLFKGPLAPRENITVEFDAHVVMSGTNTNTQNATAWCEETGTWVYDEDSVIINPPQLPPTPFPIYGWVYRNGDPVNNPKVNITILNTTEVFIAETNESYNYYQLLTDSEHLGTDNVLHFHATDDGNATEFTHTITQEEMNNGGLFNFNISLAAPAPKTHTISLVKGWNLISVPLNLSFWELGNESVVGDPLNVTPKNSLTSIYRYNTTSGLFEKCDHFDDWGWWPATGSENFTKLEPGSGYWVMAKNDCNLTFTGTAPSDINVTLNESWNLIGWYSMEEALLGEEAVVGDPLNVTPKDSLTSIYRYNTTSGLFEKCDHFDDWGWWPATGSESFTKLEPGRGYWVMAKNDCEWRHKQKDGEK